MGYRAGFYVIVASVGLLAAMGLGLIGPAAQQDSRGQMVVASPLAGDNTIDENSDDVGDNGEGDGDGDNNIAEGDNAEGDNAETTETVVVVTGPAPAPPQPQVVVVGPPPVVVQQPAGPCIFTLGFQDLRNRVVAEYGDVIGPCLENEHGNVRPDGSLENRDTLQRTAPPTGQPGLMVWQQVTNTMRFTDGFRTWTYSACGLQMRLNTQTFVWETSAAIAAQVVPAPGTCNVA